MNERHNHLRMVTGDATCQDPDLSREERMFLAELTDDPIDVRRARISELREEMPTVFTSGRVPRSSGKFLAKSIAERGAVVAEGLSWLVEVNDRAESSLAKQEASRALAQALYAITASREERTTVGVLGRTLRSAGEWAEEVLMTLSVLQRFGRNRWTCRWERAWRWCSVSLALAATLAMGLGSFVAATEVIWIRGLVGLVLRPPMFDSTGQPSYRADWAGSVADHAGDALILVGVGAFMLHEGSEWGMIPLLASVMTLLGIISRLAALQQGLYMKRWPLDMLAQYLSNLVVMPLAFCADRFSSGHRPVLLLIAVIPITFALIDLARVHRYGQRALSPPGGDLGQLEMDTRLAGAVLRSMHDGTILSPFAPWPRRAPLGEATGVDSSPGPLHAVGDLRVPDGTEHPAELMRPS